MGNKVRKGKKKKKKKKEGTKKFEKTADPSIFITALFTTAKICKQPQWPSMDEQIETAVCACVCVYTHIYIYIIQPKIRMKSCHFVTA